jgi:1,4-dihydroxy-2-naphthoyl-CoA hydrolase
MSQPPACPFCDAHEVELVSHFGSQILTAQWKCVTCGSYFEAVRDEFDDRPSETAVARAVDQRPTAIPAGFAPIVALDRGFDAVYGLEIDDDGTHDGVLRGRVAIRDRVRQQFGLLHGGVVAAIAEALASRGTWLAVHDQGKLVMGLSNETSFLRPLTEGYLHATAVARHQDVTRWVWEVQSRDDDGRLCAITTVNIAVR